MAQDYTDCCKGYSESLDVIKKTMQEQVLEDNSRIILVNSPLNKSCGYLLEAPQ